MRVHIVGIGNHYPLGKNRKVAVKMLAVQSTDKGISSVLSTAFHFGTDYKRGTMITHEMANEVLGFSIEKVQSCRPNGLVIPNQYHLVRTDTDTLVDASSSVGNQFSTAIQPFEVLEFAEGLMRAVSGLKLETVATLNDGATQMCALVLGDLMVVRGDKSPRYDHILLHNPLTRGRLSILAHNVRIVCENTLQAALASGVGYRISHTIRASEMVHNALLTLKDETEKLSEMNAKINLLASRDVTTADVDKLMDIVYPLPTIAEGDKTNALTRMTTKRDEVLEQFEKDDSFTEKTYWTLLNAMTYMEEHPLHKQERVDDAKVTYDNLVGSRSAEKSRIFNAVYEYATNDNALPYIDVAVA